MPYSTGSDVMGSALEPIDSFTADYQDRHSLPTLSIVSTAVCRLVADSRIDNNDGKYRIIDPLFAHYLRKTSARRG